MATLHTVHGGLDEAELRALGLRPDQVLDFSANINPLGPSERVKQAAAEAVLSAYPDRHSLRLREALAARLDVGTDNLLIGNGSTELIHLLARAFLRPGVGCLLFTPTFGEYEAAAALAGADIHVARAEEAQGFRWNIDTAIELITQTRPRLLFLCNPNNPTGVYLSSIDVGKLLHALGEDSLLVLDDAYVPFADHPWDSLSLLSCGKIAILRSMTKDHALAGVRLGYLIAEPQVVSVVARLQPSWSVNAVAQATGLAALDDDTHVSTARDVISEAKAYIYGELNTLGIPFMESSANFVLARVGDASQVRGALLQRGIAVRDCTSFGLPEHIRIAVRRPEECVTLISALREFQGDE